LANARTDERERQRQYRARIRNEVGADPPVSLTGLSQELCEFVDEITQNVGQAQRLSLTGLRRRLRRITLKTLGKMNRNAENLGHDPSLSLTGLCS